jgi:hypothetical protein
MSDPVSAVGPIITSPIVMGGAAPLAEGASAVSVADPATATTTTVSTTDPVTGATVSTTTTPAADPAAPAAVADPNAPAKPAAEPQDWAIRRINEVTAKRHAAERQAQVAEEKLAAAEKANTELLAKFGGTPNGAAPDPNAAAKPALGEDEIERRAVAKANEIAATNEFNRACNAVAESGKAEFKDSWDAALKNLGLVGALGQGASQDFLSTAIELKSPEKVLHYLGSNLEQAEKLVKLSPMKMAVEMARIEAQLNAPVLAPVVPPAVIHVSGAPAPVIPVGGAAKPGAMTIDDPNISMEEFNRLRMDQAEARRKRYQRA